MKIRQITNHAVVEEVSSQAPVVYSHEFCWSKHDYAGGTITLYSKRLWELVPVEVWRPANVTICHDRHISIDPLAPGPLPCEIMLPDRLRMIDLGDGCIRFEERVSS